MSQLRNKSALVSLGTAGLEVATFAALTQVLFGPALLMARWVVGMCGAAANFGCNRVFVFRQTGEGAVRQATRYGVASLASVTTSTSLLAFLCARTAVDPRILHPVSMMAVWSVLTFPLMRKWVFGPSEPL